MSKHAFFLDLLVVLVFAAMGRASHDLDVGVLGVLATASPFLFGMALGWLAVVFTPRAWRRWWLSGTVIAVCTLFFGMLLRFLTNQGTATPFVLVASGVLVVGFIGWRAVEALAVRSRTPERAAR